MKCSDQSAVLKTGIHQEHWQNGWASYCLNEFLRLRLVTNVF